MSDNNTNKQNAESKTLPSKAPDTSIAAAILRHMIEQYEKNSGR